VGGLSRIDRSLKSINPHILRKVCAALAGTITNGVSLLILLEMLVPINRLLAAGRMDEPDAATVTKVLVGGALLIIFSMGWLSGLIVTYRYYYHTDRFKILAGRFLFVTSLEILIIPLVLFSRILVFDYKIHGADGLITILCILLAGGAFAGSRRLRFGKAAETPN
jgi:hypothetical protein